MGSDGTVDHTSEAGAWAHTLPPPRKRRLNWLLLGSPWPLPTTVHGVGLDADIGMVGGEYPCDIPRWGMAVTTSAPGCQFAEWVTRDYPLGSYPPPPTHPDTEYAVEFNLKTRDVKMYSPLSNILVRGGGRDV